MSPKRKPNAGELLEALMNYNRALEDLETAGVAEILGKPIAAAVRDARDLESEAAHSAAVEIARLVFELIGERPSGLPTEIDQVFVRVTKILELKGWSSMGLDFALDYARDGILGDDFAFVFGDSATAACAVEVYSETNDPFSRSSL